jgi:hypothetical protein
MMHFILLILVVPFALLTILIMASFVVLAASLALEFPLILASAVVLGILGHFLMNPNARMGIPCRLI